MVVGPHQSLSLRRCSLSPRRRSQLPRCPLRQEGGEGTPPTLVRPPPPLPVPSKQGTVGLGGGIRSSEAQNLGPERGGRLQERRPITRENWLFQLSGFSRETETKAVTVKPSSRPDQEKSSPGKPDGLAHWRAQVSCDRTTLEPPPRPATLPSRALRERSPLLLPHSNSMGERLRLTRP